VFVPLEGLQVPWEPYLTCSPKFMRIDSLVVRSATRLLAIRTLYCLLLIIDVIIMKIFDIVFVT
jgi:hypothetical protein